MSQFYNSHGPVWAEMEQISFNPVSLVSSLCAPLPVSKKNLKNPCGINTLKIWCRFGSHFKYKQALTPKPMTMNAVFPPSLLDSGWRHTILFVMELPNSCPTSVERRHNQAQWLSSVLHWVNVNCMLKSEQKDLKIKSAIAQLCLNKPP